MTNVSFRTGRRARGQINKCACGGGGGGGGTILVCVPLLPSKKDGSKNIWGAHALAMIMVGFSQTMCLMGRP